MYADFSSHRTLMKSGRYDDTVRFLFSIVPWVFVKKIKAVTMKSGCISHLQTLGRSMHLEIDMVIANTSKKDPPRTNATKEETEHMEKKATIRNHHNHPYDLYALPCAQFGNVHNNGSPRSSSNDMMRPRHPLFSLFVAQCFFHLHHVTLHVTLHLTICLVLQKKRTYRDYTSSVQKSCQLYASVLYCLRKESGKETLRLQTLENWKRWTHQNSTPEGSMQRKC